MIPILQTANEANSHYPSTGGDTGDLATVNNPYSGWAADVGPSQFNRTNILLAEFVYNIPLFRSTDNHLLKTVVGGWTLSGIVTAESEAIR